MRSGICSLEVTLGKAGSRVEERAGEQDTVGTDNYFQKFNLEGEG